MLERGDPTTPKKVRRFDADDAAEPFGLFQGWLREASMTEPNDPDACALATATVDGTPSVRMVLMKGLIPAGFTFYTNSESQKGRELGINPHAAMCFHWKSQRRQVRVEGGVRELRAEDADRYFHSRARRSQIGAAASAQSRPLTSREELMNAVRAVEFSFPGEVPRPQDWRGYVLQPRKIEFWQDGEFRLHDRIAFERTEGGWTKQRLFP